MNTQKVNFYYLFRALRPALYGILLSIGAVFFSHGSSAHAMATKTCETMDIPVALSAGAAKDQTIHGTLCRPASETNPQTVDVLVPGGTYDSLYWDFPYQPEKYSYVDHTLNAGRATFNLDRLGTGKSSIPPSAQVTFDADTYTLHQAIQWLKDQRHFSDISMVGHSEGSITAVQEAGIYHDVNRIVATGYLHTPSINLILTAAGGLYPAALDPQFAGKILDPLYLTTTPGRRGPAFYYSADPNVVAYDEAHKNIVSSAAAAGAIAQLLVPPALNKSSDVTAPVLTVVGDHDVLCGTPPVIQPDCSDVASVKAHEQPYFTKSSSYSAITIPNTGHNLPLHPSADDSFAKINQWIQTH